VAEPSLPPAWLGAATWALLSLSIAAIALSSLWDRWSGITLTDQHAIVHNVRTRVVAWWDVVDVEVGAWSNVVVLITSYGKIRLRGPTGHRSAPPGCRDDHQMVATTRWNATVEASSRS